MSQNEFETPILGLPVIAPAQAQKHVTHNEALRILDAVAQLAVTSFIAAPPAQPAEGDRYIVAANPTGAFAGQTGKVAAFLDGAWMFITPRAGFTAWVAAENRRHVHVGSGWVADATGPGSDVLTSRLAVNTTLDAANRVAVKANSALFSHDDVTPGSGDMRLTLNKAAPARTTALVLQSAWSGRAEIGLAGNDTLSFKVSANGADWKQALTIDPASGVVELPLTPQRRLLTGPRTYFVRTDGNDANLGLTDSAAGAFRTIQKALTTVYSTLDTATHDVTIKVANGTYAEALSIPGAQVGAGRIIILGDTAVPSNVTLSSGSAIGINVAGVGARLFIGGIKLTGTGFASLYAHQGGTILTFGPIEFGTGGAYHMAALNTGSLLVNHGVTVSGGCAGSHVLVLGQGYASLQAAPWTFVGGPVLGGSFVEAVAGSVVSTGSNSFSGAVTGRRYACSLNSVILTNSGGDPNYFPGTTAGLVNGGGQYS
ncbi:MAG: DUF2793 domain-containing protein [Rhizobiaceae bacterium]|nr:DUF2793 domain-containing protein [Rhizobiaceae bacterium]